LEAVYYLATSRSPHADQDQQLINWEAVQSDEPIVVGRLIAQFATSSGDRHIEMRLIQERNSGRRNDQRSFRRQALVERRKVRLMDLLGNLRVVMFLPQDMQLLTGPPSGRRRYLDITLCQIDPIYCRTLSNYNKVLEQRNALLRQIAEGSGDHNVLPVFSEKLIGLGSQIFVRRAAFLTEIAREAQRVHYEELTPGLESIRLGYLPRLQENAAGRSRKITGLNSVGEWLQENRMDLDAVANRFEEAMETVLPGDLARGATSIGPHRDDWQFWIDGRLLSSYGSRGQQRSAILALKMAEINWMVSQTGDTPILLLDEVLAELDERRRAMLLGYVMKSTQALLTTTDPGMFTAEFLSDTVSMTVSNGRVWADDGVNW
jgi:DNA replication and repair protein RecF